MSLRVLQIGADAAWRSAPRPGFRKFGVPVGGPFDRESWTWACSMAQTTQAIEVGPFGGRFVAEGTCSVVIAGASRRILIDGRLVPNGVLCLRTGESLELGVTIEGARSYLVGFRSEVTPTSSLAVLAVKRGDVLPALPAMERHLGGKPHSLSTTTIRATVGSDAQRLDPAGWPDVEWSVGTVADRTGIRLEGPEVTLDASLGDRPSEAQVFGVVQITQGGTPIILGPDGPTIGGYPRIAVVIDADLDKLGQLKPGDRFRFEMVDLAMARSARRSYHERLRETSALRS